MESSHWYLQTSLGRICATDTHCECCANNGDCDNCGTIDGRWMEAVNEYASTCDHCAEITHHSLLTMDTSSQLGYCEDCVSKVSVEIRMRLEM